MTAWIAPGQVRQRNAIWSGMDGNMWGKCTSRTSLRMVTPNPTHRRARYGADHVIKMTGPAASADGAGIARRRSSGGGPQPS